MLIAHVFCTFNALNIHNCNFIFEKKNTKFCKIDIRSFM